MKQLFPLYLVLFTLLLQGCKKDIGEIIKEERSAFGFNKIILHHKIDLIISQDTVNRISVFAGSKMISSIRTSVIDSVLTIENADNGLTNDPGTHVKVEVSGKNLHTIDYRGSGMVTSKNILKAPVFTIVSSTGAGIIDLQVESDHIVAGVYEENADIILKGKSNTAYVYCSPRGTIDMKEMEVKNLSIVYSSVRNACIWATESVTGRIYHTGNVYYKGSPVLDKEELSSGRFLPL